MTVLMLASGPQDVVDVAGTNDVRYKIDNYIGRADQRRAGPQVFLVHQAPCSVLNAHYHSVPQFQLFTGGSGTFGRKAINVPAIHYADAWTTYGPISSGESGIDYFTIRISPDVGANFMPESRHQKQRRSGRSYTAALASEAGDEQAPVRALMDEQPDGLAAYVISLQPGAPLQLPELHGDGRLVSVLDGAIEGAGERYTYRAWGYANRLAGETFNAGGAGASLLCLDYPAAGHAGARFIRERRSDE